MALCQIVAHEVKLENIRNRHQVRSQACLMMHDGTHSVVIVRACSPVHVEFVPVALACDPTARRYLTQQLSC